MPLLMILGVIVLLAAVAIFKVSKWQADRYVRLAKKAKEADDADDTLGGQENRK